jgi:YesN/AraC family two-component response regulator
MNILVVDDEPVIVMGIVSYIRKIKNLRLNAVGACSGEEALSVTQHFIPSLLITDVQMPQMNGLELIEKVRKKQICDHFIILTAYENFDYARQALRLHIDDYLVKPVSWPSLENHVRTVAMQPEKQVRMDLVAQAYTELFSEPDSSKGSISLKKILKYINGNYSADISLTQASEFSEISENYICALFKKELGITFLDYVHKLRMRKAIELLLTETGKTVKDISIIVGYHSERQFFRMFRSMLNMTPQQFRDKYISIYTSEI